MRCPRRRVSRGGGLRRIYAAHLKRPGTKAYSVSGRHVCAVCRLEPGGDAYGVDAQCIRHICDVMNSTETSVPGSELRLAYELVS